MICRFMNYQTLIPDLNVMTAFHSGLVRSYVDFILSFDYPLWVLIPFKVIAKASRESSILNTL